MYALMRRREVSLVTPDSIGSFFLNIDLEQEKCMELLERMLDEIVLGG